MIESSKEWSADAIRPSNGTKRAAPKKKEKKENQSSG